MKKLLIIVLISFVLAGCEASRQEERQSHAKRNDTVETVNKETEDDSTEQKESAEEKNTETKNIQDDGNEVNASKKDESVSNREDKKQTAESLGYPKKSEASTKQKKEEGQAKIDSNSLKQVQEQTLKNEVPVVENKENKSVIYDYDTGNCGKLYNSESEAMNEAERRFNDYSDPKKYVSSYTVYSTYDKWTISYYYAYY